MTDPCPATAPFFESPSPTPPHAATHAEALEHSKRQLIHAYVCHCALLAQKALQEQVSSALVLQDLAWLSARCQKLCDSNDLALIQTALQDSSYWHSSLAQAKYTRHVLDGLAPD